MANLLSGSRWDGCFQVVGLDSSNKGYCRRYLSDVTRFLYPVWIGNFPNPNFVFPIFPIFPGKYKKQVYKSGYEFVKQNISQVFISEIYFPGNMGNINYISREIPLEIEICEIL